MSGRVEKANASRKVSCKKRSKIKTYKIQREKKHNKYTIFIINISIIISLSNITVAITVTLHWLELCSLKNTTFRSNRLSSLGLSPFNLIKHARLGSNNNGLNPQTPRLVPRVHFLCKIPPKAHTNYLVKMSCLINQGHTGAQSVS